MKKHLKFLKKCVLFLCIICICIQILYNAIDYMKWSSVKKEAVETICKLDENQSLSSYYFPNIRYHLRWKELSEDDFLFSDMAVHYELKGYAPLSASCGIEDYRPFEAGTTEDKQDMVPLMKEYLDKIVKLCEEKEILLILVKTPSTAENAAKFHTIQEFAEENKLEFWDFNEKELYNKIGFCFSTNNNDGGHGNFWGAKKVTGYIGKMLTAQYGMEEKMDKQWEDTKRYYEGMQKDCELVRIKDIDEYLVALNDKRYSIFISSKEKCTP